METLVPENPEHQSRARRVANKVKSVLAAIREATDLSTFGLAQLGYGPKQPSHVTDEEKLADDWEQATGFNRD